MATHRGWIRRFAVSLSLMFFLSVAATGQAGLIQKLEAGEKQTIVAYGTSLTANATWVAGLRDFFKIHYPNQTTVLNRAKAGASSKWGSAYLADSVIQNEPDMLLLEFAINDAFESHGISVKDSRQNLTEMIDRVLLASPDCEIVLLLLSEPYGRYRTLRPDLDRYYTMYREVARERGLLLIDLTTEWKTGAGGAERLEVYLPDGIHLSPLADREVVTPGVLKALGFNPQPE